VEVKKVMTKGRSKSKERAKKKICGDFWYFQTPPNFLSPQNSGCALPSLIIMLTPSGMMSLTMPSKYLFYH
jgi:hypothetical protein